MIRGLRFDNLALTCYPLSEHQLNDQRTVDRLPDQLPPDPMHWAETWIREATASHIQPHPNAMTLSTVDEDNRPSSRVVLCKAFVPDPGYLVFYTNYRSRKSTEISGNPLVSVGFHWDELGRQIRIEGIAVRSPDAESDAYFATRDRGSQLGAWGSDQSEVIASRDALVRQIQQRAGALGIQLASGTEPTAGENAPPIGRPPHWGGFRVWASGIELWISGDDRIHDRATWHRELLRLPDGGFSATPWTGARLQP